MPLVATALDVLGEQDGTWSECELLAQPRFEFQCPTQSDHVLASGGAMPIQARTRRAFLERHLGRLPGPGSMGGAFEFRQLDSALLEVRLVIVAGVEPDERKRHRFFLLTVRESRHVGLHGGEDGRYKCAERTA